MPRTRTESGGGPERVRWGIIGAGDVVRKRVAAAIQGDEHSQLVSACRRNKTALAEFSRQFNLEKSSTDAADLITDPDLDALYIATPVYLHLPQTLAAAQAGKHVLVEKPMGMSTDECRQMVEVCARADVRLGVAYYRRFYPVIDRMKEVLADGAIGTVLSVTAVTSAAFAMTRKDDGYWRVILEQGGGGALMDVGSHRLNLFLDLFGPIRTVKAICGTVAADYASEDCASVVVEFESGVHGHLQCLFGLSVEQDVFTILGTKGRLTSDRLNGGGLTLQTREGVRSEDHPPAENFSTPLIADFVRAIREGEPPRVSGAEGVLTNEVMERAYADSAG